MYHIQLPQIIQTNRQGFQDIIGIFDSLASGVDKDGYVDFSKCEILESNLCAILGSIFDELINRGFIVRLIPPKEKSLKKALAQNNFFRAFEPDISSEDPQNFIYYNRFAPNQTQEFKEYIDSQLIKKQRFPRHSELAGKRILESIFEIFTNAVTHGCCNYIYACGEYHGLQQPVLDMTIVDRGRTFYNLVNEHLSAKQPTEQLSPPEAIKWATINGHTTKSTPGGLGLALILEFLVLNRGILQIVPHKGLLIYKDGDFEEYTLDSAFDGSIVNMRFNFDDDKKYFMAEEQDSNNDLL